MVTPDNATRLLCRIMLAVWLCLICGMAVAALGGGASTGNLLALLFTGPVTGTPVMTPPAPPPAPQPEPAPKPEPAPVQATSAPAEASGWREMPRGKRPGRGRLLPPQIEVRKDGSLLLLFPYEGTLGECTTITPANVPSRSIDLHGQWRSQLTVDTRPRDGCVKRLQIATHPGWIRVSAVSRDGRAPNIDARFTDKELRIIFSAPAAPAVAPTAASEEAAR